MAKAKQIETLPVEPLLLRAKEASALCGIAVSTWAELRNAGKLPPSIKLGKARLYKLDLLRKWTCWNCPTIDKFSQLLAAEGKR